MYFPSIYSLYLIDCQTTRSDSLGRLDSFPHFFASFIFQLPIISCILHIMSFCCCLVFASSEVVTTHVLSSKLQSFVCFFVCFVAVLYCSCTHTLSLYPSLFHYCCIWQPFCHMFCFLISCIVFECVFSVCQTVTFFPSLVSLPFLLTFYNEL